MVSGQSLALPRNYSKKQMSWPSIVPSIAKQVLHACDCQRHKYPSIISLGAHFGAARCKHWRSAQVYVQDKSGMDPEWILWVMDNIILLM